ncbi:unnamed protein product [Amoebophrya sp. A25]|nr:unnamed protein product [Amoebophrya sp. A25]|eukprot:GSA25T00006504001.1
MSVNLRRAVTRGTTRRSGAKFCSYEEFVDFVKPLKFTRVEDFFAWRRTRSRPPFIPTRPERIYRRCGKWTSSSWNALLHRSPPAKTEVAANAARNETRQYFEARNRRGCNFERAIEWFQNIARESTSGSYEFLRVPNRAAANLLFRKRCENYEHGLTNSNTSCPKKQASDSRWAILQVKTTEGRDGGYGFENSIAKYHFRGITSHPDVGVVFVCSPEETIKFAQSSSELRIETPKRRVKLDYLPCHGKDEIAANVERLWQSLPRKRLVDWCTKTSLFDGRHGFFRKMALQATESLYHPAGLSRFDSGASYGAAHNFSLGDCTCMQRVVTLFANGRIRARFDQRVRVTASHTTSAATGRLLSKPSSASDSIDIFVFLVCDAQKQYLRGLFMFPKWFVMRHHCLADPLTGTAGRTSWRLYPPDTPSLNMLVRDKAAGAMREQQLFYLDLSGDQPQASVIQKFHRILKSAKNIGNFLRHDVILENRYV